MSWADQAIQQLQAGETVVLHPRGNSMTPKIRSGQAVTVAPVDGEDVQRGDIVLVRMNARTTYLHLVHATDRNRVCIANNHGRINGWTSRSNVYGRVVRTQH